jgi:hypothetical protein
MTKYHVLAYAASALLVILGVMVVQLNRLLIRAWKREDWYHDELHKRL